MSPPKDLNVALQNVLTLSAELVRLAGSASNPKAGAAALALALGRLCALRQVDMEQVQMLVRAGFEGSAPLGRRRH